MRALRALIIATALLLGAAAPAGAHSFSAQASGAVAGVKGMSEKQLRSFETRVLGPSHAREHAMMRRFARSAKGRALAGRQARSAKRARTRARAAAVCDPATAAQVGCWTDDPFPIGVMGINMALLPTGKVLVYAYPSNPSWDPGAKPNEGWAAIVDPVTKQSRRVDPPINPGTGAKVNIWCSGTSFLPDGRVLVTGGTLAYQGGGATWKGLNQVYTFNPFTDQWQRQQDMRHGRWYPTQVQLPDGRTLIASGLDETGTASGADTPLNKEMEVFNPADGTVKLATGPATTLQGMYPHMWQMPSGRILVAGPYPNDSFFLGLTTGSLSYSFGQIPDPVQRYWGTGVLLPGQLNKAMLIGGADRLADPNNPGSTHVQNSAKATTEVFDENNPGAGWQPASPLNVARAHQNTVQLPDSSMVTIGGGRGMHIINNPTKSNTADENNYPYDEVQKRVEVWDPVSGRWSLGPAQAEPRTYHSTAVLLPDGRVLSAGDDFNGGTNQDTAEIYSPAYLFKGPRPAITGAPAAVAPNGTFGVATPNTDIDRAVFVAPGATTHAVDMNQRVIPVAVSKANGGYNLTAPAANYAPPGYYMLFLVNKANVPSVAAWVKLDPAAGQPQVLGTEPASPPAGAPAGRLIVRLGSFEKRSLKPWKRVSGSNARTRTHKQGKYARVLRGTRRRSGIISRALPKKVTAGTYEVRLWVRGRAYVKVGGGKLKRADSKSSKRWRRRSVTVRVTGPGKRISLRAAKRGRVIVDDVRLIAPRR